MSLLHATWLPAIRTSGSTGQPALLIWADTWRVAAPVLAETGWHDIDGGSSILAGRAPAPA